jgi:hypothetical protein
LVHYRTWTNQPSPYGAKRHKTWCHSSSFITAVTSSQARPMPWILSSYTLLDWLQMEAKASRSAGVDCNRPSVEHEPDPHCQQELAQAGGNQQAQGVQLEQRKW